MAAKIPRENANVHAEATGLTFRHLKAEHRCLRDGLPEAVALRTHRALSWLERSEMETVDEDGRFLFLWIAFNAAYAREIHNREEFTERRVLMTFLHELIAADTEDLIYNAVWKHFPQSVRLLLNNKYVFQPFWDCQNGCISDDEWRSKFSLSKRAATKALGRMDTMKVVAILFSGYTWFATNWCTAGPPGTAESTAARSLIAPKSWESSSRS